MLVIKKPSLRSLRWSHNARAAHARKFNLEEDMQGYVQVKEAHEKKILNGTLGLSTTIALAHEDVSANDGLQLEEHNKSTGQRLAQKISQQTISKRLAFLSQKKSQECHCSQYRNQSSANWSKLWRRALQSSVWEGNLAAILSGWMVRICGFVQQSQIFEGMIGYCECEGRDRKLFDLYD